MPLFVERIALPVSPEVALTWHSRRGAFERLVAPWDHVEMRSRTGGIDSGEVEVAIWAAGIRTTWRMRHTDFRPGEEFCDEQVSGPMAAWRHRHRFLPGPQGTCVLE